MAKKTLDELIENKDQYDAQDQAVLVSLVKTRENLELMRSMTRTAGWKLLEQSIREELHVRIYELIKNDGTIMALMDVLNASSSKKIAKILDAEIEKILPEGS